MLDRELKLTFLLNILKWSLVCDLRWMKATITSIQFGGVLAGAVIGGQSGDYFGRKRILYGAYLLHAILNVIAAFSTSWQMFAVMRFLIGTMIGKSRLRSTDLNFLPSENIATRLERIR